MGDPPGEEVGRPGAIISVLRERRRRRAVPCRQPMRTPRTQRGALGGARIYLSVSAQAPVDSPFVRRRAGEPAAPLLARQPGVGQPLPGSPHAYARRHPRPRPSTQKPRPAPPPARRRPALSRPASCICMKPGRCHAPSRAGGGGGPAPSWLASCICMKPGRCHAPSRTQATPRSPPAPARPARACEARRGAARCGRRGSLRSL